MFVNIEFADKLKNPSIMVVYSGEGDIPAWLPLDSPFDSGLTFSELP